ncbi:F-box protein SKIP23-like [Cornus florida]|uniref:F-box protein SKIP23-like n=1 Tax=Cornus florida TaxID=4283 RepID=UPI00289E9C10|nr:F-box protein SKIP23-like [Cornus florida]
MHNTVQNYFSLPPTPPHTPGPHHHLLQTPLLMLPFEEEECDIDDDGFFTDDVGSFSRFFDLEHKRVGRLNNVPRELYNSHCVGSSHGWLVLLDENTDLFLLNLFSRVRIQLPNKEALPHILSVQKNSEGTVLVTYKVGHYRQYTSPLKYLHKQLIRKVILSSNPSHNNNYRIVIIDGNQLKLAFFRPGDDAWTGLEVWGFHGSLPIKITTIDPSFPIKEVEEPWQKDLYTTRCYLVETSGDLLLVERYTGEYVHDGVPVYEEDLLNGQTNHPLVCPYKTLQFRVYKLEFGQKKWVEVKSLSNSMLFLDGNHSMSLSAHDFPEYKANSIYFTDDYGDRMDEDYLYGGHDMSIFNLDDRSVEPFYQCNMQKIQPPPFWVVPNP